MTHQYFKQAWQLIKQNKLYSYIYIAGTALGISMVMVLAILNYVKTANIYPEMNRDKIMYVESIEVTPVDTIRFKYKNYGTLSYKAARLIFMPLKTPKKISVMMSGSDFASLPNDDNLITIKSRFVDTNYWDIFDFHFLSGKPFSDADFQSGIKTAVITESLAKSVFGTTDAVGKYLDYGFEPFRVTGVVKDVSYVMSETYAQIWIPYTCVRDYNFESGERGGMIGDIDKVYMLASSASDFDAIRNEVDENARRYNAQATDWKINLLEQPDVHSVAINRVWSNVIPDIKKIRIQNILLVFLLLLVPAINLSGMNSSRMERRLGEMGVRKAFGASRSRLVKQVMTENLLLTGLGGLAGLILSYVIILLSSSWILDMGKSFADAPPEGISVNFSLSMLLNGKVFIIVLLVCLVMNILSALIPVYRSLRKQITDSLHIKYN